MKPQNSVFAGTALLALLAAGPVFAEGDQDQDRAIEIYAQGGGINSTRHFDLNTDSKFKVGYDVGGGVGVDVNRYLAVRGSFAFVRAQALDPDLELTGFDGSMFDRYVYSGDVRLGYPVKGGVTPYLLAGGGAMTFSNRTDLTAANFTRGFGKAGVGLAYDIPHSAVGLFVQGTGLLYSLNNVGPTSRTLFDTTWTGGLRLRLRI
jgi:opacity protein-like surface antigen